MLRILVVEDDPAVRMLVDRVLTSNGYHVQTAPSAHAALAYILYDLPVAPDLAILDITLPEMTGIACADVLRRHFPEIRLVFMTGWAEKHVEHEEARRRGPLLEKPFSPRELLEIVARAR